MKLLLTITLMLASINAISQKSKDLEFDKLELLIGKKIDTGYFRPIRENEKASYQKLADFYNVSYTAKADTFLYKNYPVLGPWLCISGDTICAVIFYVTCNADISKFLLEKLGAPSYSKGAFFFTNKSDIKLLYVWPKPGANIFLSLNECTGKHVAFNCIESAIISVQSKNGALAFRGF